MRSMFGRLGFVGLWVAGWLLPGVLGFDGGFAGGRPGGWGVGLAQAAEMQDQWRTLQEAQAAYQRGILAVQRGDNAAAEAAWGVASDGFRRVLAQNPQHTELYAT